MFLPVVLCGSVRASADPIPSLSPAVRYRAADAVWSGSALASWLDSSGNGRHCTDVLATKATVSGRTVVRTTAADSNYIKTPSFSVSQPYTLIVVGGPRPHSANRRLVDGGNVNDAVISQSGGGIGSTYPYRLYAGSEFTCEVDGVSNTRDVFVCVFDGASSKQVIGRRTAGTGNPGSGGITAGLVLAAAGNFSAGFYDDADYEEIVIVPGALTTPQITAIQAYYRSTYPITRGVTCCGDSITDGYGLGDPTTQSYPAQLQTLLGSGYSVGRHGYVGEETPAILTFSRTDALGGLTGLRSADTVMWWSGTNDLYFGASAATAFSRLQTAWAACRALGATKVVGFTALPRTAGSPPADFETQRAALNTSIRNAVGTDLDAVVDVAAESWASDTMNTTYYLDQAHTTAYADGLIAALAAPKV